MGLANAVLLHAEMKFFEAEIEYNAAKIYDSIRSHVIGTSKMSDSCCTIITNFVKKVLLENDYTVETVAMENNDRIVISWDNKDKEKQI